MPTIKRLDRPPLLHVSVQESLKAYIDEAQLKPGAALPPEGELAQRLGVSRNSVREAIKALESVGIIETRRGIGVFVRDFSFDPLLDHLPYGLGRELRDVGDVLQIRCTLEFGLIADCVTAIGEADLAALRLTLDAMRAKAERGEAFPEEDQQFHRLLFRCLGNRVLDRLIEIFWVAFHKASGFFSLGNPDPIATWRDHEEIYDAVVARDAVRARDRLERHYRGIRSVLAR
ncbi:FadR/GntR family transcriptional regulator [Labrys wisconsinensis]|uniref:DNA-binding FadR family transcriptional regulator n=1 Tax=Labrys wisconsinensis TaxID=425677 RepID=A0ABU0JBN9_9HYPH|nr:FadR/GntR family transcriptional regulator [Labrys wisconsinensis]MDQ0471700.1 DNA-binding FadR family transcriptional regulator [Labrys wisconsinensis]